LGARVNAARGGAIVQFSSRQFVDIVVAAPVGRIDHAAAGQLEQSLAPLLAETPSGKGGLILDLSGVDYISSVGLRILMIAAKQMRGRGARIAVAALQPVVAEIFAISRFDSVLDVFPSVRDGITKLSPPALAAFDAK
jgi:anti-sigma B factor antagonist/stage II sporulation protein AA (anti-sigma F factor antagonist)